MSQNERIMRKEDNKQSCPEAHYFTFFLLISCKEVYIIKKKAYFCKKIMIYLRKWI